MGSKSPNTGSVSTSVVLRVSGKIPGEIVHRQSIDWIGHVHKRDSHSEDTNRLWCERRKCTSFHYINLMNFGNINSLRLIINSPLIKLNSIVCENTSGRVSSVQNERFVFLLFSFCVQKLNLHSIRCQLVESFWSGQRRWTNLLFWWNCEIDSFDVITVNQFMDEKSS